MRERPERRRQRRAREELGDVHDLPGEGRGARGPRRIVPQEVPVRLHVGAAPGGVDHDRLHVSGLERGNRGAGERAGSLGLAGVRVERAAAALGPRHPHLEPLPREAADRGLVVRAEHRVLHAALEEPDPAAHRPLGRDHLGQRAPAPGRRERREERLRGSEGRREEPQHAARPDEPLEPAPLVEAERASDRAEERGARQEHVERRAPHQPSQRRPRALRLELRAPRLDQVAVLDTRGTRALARPAAEAERQMLGRGVGEPDAAVGERLDEVDAPARGIRLLAELGVRRTAR